jgi:hypothetical protein
MCCCGQDRKVASLDGIRACGVERSVGSQQLSTEYKETIRLQKEFIPVLIGMIGMAKGMGVHEVILIVSGSNHRPHRRK